MAGTISFSGISASGIDTSAWVDALVSVKQQTITTLQEQQEAQEKLLSVVNEIKTFFTSFQNCLSKITDSQFGIPSMDLFLQNLAISSNTNIATATATTEASRQSYDVLVDSLATATRATSGRTIYEEVFATLDTKLGLLGAKNGTITVNSQAFSITTENTIRDLISKFKEVGVSSNFDEEKGTFTVSVGLNEIDEGATNIKSALKLQDNSIGGAVSGSLVYVTRDTEFSKLKLTAGKVMIEGEEHTISQNGNNYSISKVGGQVADLNTVGDFFDYLMSSEVGAEDAKVDGIGNITIKGATLDKVEGGSNILDVLNLTETQNRIVMESGKLTYSQNHVADLTTKLSDLGINNDTELVVAGNASNITSDMTLGDVKNIMNAGGVDFDIDKTGVITVDTKGNEISGTLLDALGLDPSKGGTTITSSPHTARFDADGNTLLSDLGIDDSMKFIAYKSDGTAISAEISGLSNKTVDEFIANLKDLGLDASFDSVNHQIKIDNGYIEGTVADALGMSSQTTTYTEAATLNTTLEKFGATGVQTLVIDGGTTKTYSKDTSLNTILNDIIDAGAEVSFKNGNLEIKGVTLGGTLPALLGLDATTSGSSVTSGALTITTGSSSSGGDMSETVENDITLDSKIGDILGTTIDYTLKVDNGNTVTYTKDTTLATLKNHIETAGGVFKINDDNTITIDGVTMSGTLVGALGFDSVDNGTKFSTVNPIMVSGTSNVATGGTTLGGLGIVQTTTRALPTNMTLKINGGQEIVYDASTTLDDIFADIIAAGGTAKIDSEGYLEINGVHLEGTLVDALGLKVTSNKTTITSGNLEVTTSTTSTSSSSLYGKEGGDITWDSTIGSIIGDNNSYSLSINGNNKNYASNTKLSDIKSVIEAAGGSMTINSDNTIDIQGVTLSGTLFDALGFVVTDYKTVISSNNPIYAKGEDVEANENTKFSDLGISADLREYEIYANDGSLIKVTSSAGSSGDSTIGDWLATLNNALNAANGTSGQKYATINNGIISITGGYITGALPTALDIRTETIVTDVTMTGNSVSYVEYKPLSYIGTVDLGTGDSGKDVSHNGSISNSITQGGTASSDINSSGLIGPEDEFVDLFGNITDATLNATLSELLKPNSDDPLNNDARLPADSYTLKIGTYATKTFDSDTTKLSDVISYIENLKTYDPTYDMAFDAYLSGDKLVIKSDAAITGTLTDVLGLTKVNTEDEYYTYVAKSVKYTDLVEGASNGFNFSIVGDKVDYDTTTPGVDGKYSFTGEQINVAQNITYTQDAIQISAGGNTYASSSDKLVDIFGSGVIGKKVNVSVGVGSGHSSGTIRGIGLPNQGIGSGITHMPPSDPSFETYTIDSSTTLAILTGWDDMYSNISYDSSTGKLTVTETVWNDGCSGELSGDFFTFLNSALGSPEISIDHGTLNDHTETKSVYQLKTTGYEDPTYASKTTTVKDLGYNYSTSFVVTKSDGSKTTLSFSASDTIGTIFNKLAELGINASIDSSGRITYQSNFDWDASGTLGEKIAGNADGSATGFDPNVKYGTTYTGSTVQTMAISGAIPSLSTKISSLTSWAVGKRIWVKANSYTGPTTGLVANSFEFSYLDITSSTTVQDVLNLYNKSGARATWDSSTGEIVVNVSAGFSISTGGVFAMTSPPIDTEQQYTVRVSMPHLPGTPAKDATTYTKISDLGLFLNVGFNVTNNGSTTTLSFSNTDTISTVLDKLNALDGVTATFVNSKLEVTSTHNDLAFSPSGNANFLNKIFGGSVPTPVTNNPSGPASTTAKLSTKVSELFNGSTSSQTLTLKDSTGATQDLTFAASNTIQDIINKLASKNITATLSADGKFTVESDERWTLSGALASKLFGGSGNEIFTYVGTKVTYKETVTTPGEINSDGFISDVNKIPEPGGGNIEIDSNGPISQNSDIAFQGGGYIKDIEDHSKDTYKALVSEVNSFISGETYAIKTADDLIKLAEIVNHNTISTSNVKFILLNDIDMTGKVFEGIGHVDSHSGVGFEGIFYGNGHVIKNLNTVDNKASTVSNGYGLFASINAGAVVQDLGLINARVSGRGALANDNYGTVSNVFVTNSTVVAENISTTYDKYSYEDVSNAVGGLIGYSEGAVSSSWVKNTNISLDNEFPNKRIAGGLVGYGKEIEYSYTDNVSFRPTHFHTMGLLVGANGYISSNNYMGGGYIRNSYALSDDQGAYLLGYISPLIPYTGDRKDIYLTNLYTNTNNLIYKSEDTYGHIVKTNVYTNLDIDLTDKDAMEAAGFNATNGWQQGVNATPTFGIKSLSSHFFKSVQDVTLDTSFDSDYMYTISSVNDLLHLAEVLNADDTKSEGITFVLTNDIDMLGITSFEGISSFKGHLYGQGYEIKNLTISSSANNSIFNDVSDGSIQDLGFRNITLNTNEYSSVGIVGTLNNSLIKNVYVEDSEYTLDGASIVGGIVGETYNSKIEDTYVQNLVMNGKAGDVVAGLIGITSQDTKVSHSFADVKFENLEAGLIAGFVGYGESLTIDNSYAYSSIKSCNQIQDSSMNLIIGGLIAYSTGGIVVNNSYVNMSVSDITATQVDIGTIIGENTSSDNTFNNVVYNGDLGYDAIGTSSHVAHNPNPTGVIAKSLSEMQTQSVMESLGFTSANGWKYTDGLTPHFGNIIATEGSGSKVYVSSLTDFKAGDTYYLKDSADLNKLAELVNSGKSTAGVKFILENNIDMSGVANFSPIHNFEGKLYGNGHVIKNLTITSSEVSVALFSDFNPNAVTIADIGFENITINASGSHNHQYVGVLVGQICDGNNINNVYVSGGSINVLGTGTKQVGGLIGWSDLYGTTISNVYSEIDININGGDVVYAGGLFGSVGAGGYEGAVTNSYSNSKIVSNNVTQKQYIGGFAGEIYSSGGISNILNSFSTGSIVNNSNPTESYIGGFTGEIDTTGYTLNFENVYSITDINSSNGVNKAFYGIDTSDPTFDNDLNFVNTYYTSDYGLTNDVVSGLSAKTLSEMTNQSVMEGLGFTAANGWKYTNGLSPHFGNMTGSTGSTTTITHDASLSTTVGQLFGDSSNHTLTVDGNNITFSSSDTIADILDKLWNDKKIYGSMVNGTISIDSNNDHVLTGDLAQKLFGKSSVDLVGSNDGANDAYTMERSEDGSGGSTTTTTTHTLSAESYIGDLFGDSNSHTFTINGENITLGPDKTIQDLIDALKAKGYQVSINDGKFLIGSNGYEDFTISGDLANKVLGKSGTGSINSDYQTKEVTLSTSSRMEDIFWDADNHNFVINKTGAGSTTITLGKNDTIQTLIDKLRQNGIAASIDSSGMMTFKSNYKWTASGDLADLITQSSEMSMTTTNLYTYETEELEVYTGHQTVSQMLNSGQTLISGNRYHIASVEDLKALATFVNERGIDTTNIDFVLDGDIDLSSVTNFAPIGKAGNAFKGNFYGNGHVISNLTIDSTEMYVGLFGYTSDATIRDIGLKNVDVKGGQYTGALVGQAINNTEIINAYSTGNVSSASDQIGGLVGDLKSSKISNSYSSANVSGKRNVGGLIGIINDSTVENSYASGDVTASAYWAGGLAGSMMNGGNIKNAYATGNVNAKNAKGVGGLVGLIEANDGSSYNIDTVYSTGRVYGNQYTGALIGWRRSTSATISNAVYNSNLEITGVGSGSSSGLTAKTFVEMQDQSIMQGLGFTADKGWKYTQYNTPYLGNIAIEENGGSRLVSNVDELRAGDTYYIASKDDMIALANFVNGGEDTTGVTFVLQNDINMSGVDFAPIGNQDSEFKGDFYGNGHKISNLQISVTGNYAGLFGYTKDALIQDVAIVDASVEATDDYSGALVGYADKGTIIKNAYSSGTISGATYVGGLVGYNKGSIDSSYSTAEITTTDTAGGLAGVNTGTIKNSYATGNVSGWAIIGGFVGANSGTIETAYSTGRVISQNSTAGGFVGQAQNGSNISNSYSTGYVEGNSTIGGFIGEVDSGVTISGNVFNSSTTLSAVGSGSSNGITGMYLIEMWDKSKMEAQGFTADKGWKYTDETTPYLNSNVSFTNGGKVYVNQVDSFVSGEVFYIGNRADLDKLITLVNNGAVTEGVSFVLEADIDASGITSIGKSQDKAFEGLFYGNGHTISNLNTSLFGYVKDAQIQDVALENVNISSSASYVGALVGYDEGESTISNVYGKGSISGGSYVGGLVGSLGQNSSITESYSEINVSGSSNIGGLIGQSSGAVKKSYATGNITSTGSNAGGLIGNMQSGSVVNIAFATGTVNGKTNVGGLVGNLDSGSISNSYSTGIVSGTSAVGAFLGRKNGGTTTGNVYNKQAYTTDASVGSTALTMEEMQRQSIMEGLGFTADKGWSYYEGSTPTLRRKNYSDQYTIDVSLDTSLDRLGSNSISRDITVQVNGNTYQKYFNNGDTVEDVINWLNSIDGINAEFDEANSKFIVSSESGELSVTGGLANMLFGGRASTTTNTITQNTDSTHLMAEGSDEKITEATTISELLKSNNSASIGYKDESGNIVMETFDANQTLADVMAYLESKGFDVKIENGIFTAIKNDGAKTDLYGAIGSALKGSVGSTTYNPSGYVSENLSSSNSYLANGSTKLEELGISSGNIHIQDSSGNVISSITIDNEMSINDVSSLLAKYGFTLNIQNGKVTVTADGENKLIDGTSDMVSKMKLDNWVSNKDKLTNTSTVEEMGFSSGASLGVVVSGKIMPDLSFTANDTLDTIIAKLKSYGINASVDSNGKFTASADFSFVLTGELGVYLTQNSLNGYEQISNGYKSENPLEFSSSAVKLTEDTLIGDLLGTGEGGILRLTIDENTVYDLKYNANDKVQDIIADLAAYGIDVKINDGVLTATSLNKVFRLSGDIGEALSGRTPKYEDMSTGYLSKDLSYETTGTAKIDSSMKELGILAGEIHILDNNGDILKTLSVDDSFTIGQIQSMLKPYGFDMTIDSNGKVSITSNQGYILADGTSNMVSKMGLKNWNKTTEKLNLNTTISEMGFKNGADLNLFLDGLTQNILSFDANQTLQDIIFALSAYGINASVDANGQFTAESTNHTFVMSGTLGSFLTKGTTGYVNRDTGYKTYKPLEEEKKYVEMSSDELDYDKLMTADSTLSSLGFTNGGNVIVMLNGNTSYTLSFLASDTVQDVIYALSAYGINASVDSNGNFVAEALNNQFTMIGNLGSFLVSGGNYYNETTGYVSPSLNYDTVEKVTGDTKLSDLGISKGDINILKDGNPYATINITEDTTVNQLFSGIKIYGLNGEIKTDESGNTYIQISSNSNIKLADGTSNVVSGLNLIDIRQGDYEGNVVYWEDDAQSGLITGDMKLSDFDKNGFIAQGSLIVETGTGADAVEHIINITEDETINSLLKKFNDSGISASLENGIIKIHSGIDGINFKGGTSGLLNTLSLDMEDVDIYASSNSALHYTGEVNYSAANFADATTKLKTVNATDGQMSIYIDGIKSTIQINSEDTFGDLFAQISAMTYARSGVAIKAGFLDKDGNIVANPTLDNNTGIIAFEVEEGHELVIGSSIDTTNFATIANLNKSDFNRVSGSRSLYKVNSDSLITESGLYRAGDITEGTFKIGDAEFTIDATTTLNDLMTQINKSEKAYATAYWDTLSGTMVIQSTLTGASLINIEAGTSNFTDIMGFTTQKDGENALVTDSQTLGKNAVLKINGTTITSTSNVITSDISKIKGLTINLKDISKGETVTITVEQDNESIYNAVSETLDAYNQMMEALNKELADRNSLGSDPLLKLIRNQLKRLMTSSLMGDYVYKNLAAIGISTGEAQDSITTDVTNLLIDEDTFMSALELDSDAVKKLLVGTKTNPGIFLQANNIVETTVNANGYFTNLANSLTRSINKTQQKISETNQDIENYRKRLERNFQNMESVISGMQNSYSNFLNKIMS